MNPLSNIRIVLVGTTHPGNIGAAARAMKTMGLSALHLVQPKRFPDQEATARAAGADDILANARVHDDLACALADCVWVAGTSARLRGVAQWPVLAPDDTAAEALRQQANGPVALVFGRESSGLSNAELDLCHALLNIPANPDYSSLNLAAAVQVACYECRRAAGAGERVADALPPAPMQQMEAFYGHLEGVLRELGFAHDRNTPSLMRKLRRLYGRAQPTENELQILRGILTAAQTGNLHQGGSSQG